MISSFFSIVPLATSVQLELPIERPPTPDRNSAQGGRSFYFFDFDDNVMHLPTPLFLFHKVTGEERLVSTGEFAKVGELIGKEGEWEPYEIRPDPQTGSFRRFRQRQMSFWDKMKRVKQPLVEDIFNVLRTPGANWKGPSWDFFWHAVHNGRPLSIITARGHLAEGMKEGIQVLVKQKLLTQTPNYLSVLPVSNLDVRRQLGDEECLWSTAKLKKAAIHRSVEEAFKLYGFNTAHRFGMSDDDPGNIKLVIEAMQELKQKYPQNSFFVIDTQHGQLFKQEVFTDSVKKPELLASSQLSLFEKV